jgi:DNA-binding NarL/FixJ family response regulator
MSATLPSVVIVDDHEIFRSGVRSELEGLVDVRGEAGSVEDAVRLIAAEHPDVVLLDVHMPGGGGVEVVRQVAATNSAQRFLALSVSDAAEDVIAIIRAGARGYVTKSISGPELADAVARVRDGDAVFSPRLAGFVLDAFARQLSISAKTVEAHVSAVLRKLQLSSRHELSRWAVERRLVD